MRHMPPSRKNTRPRYCFSAWADFYELFFDDAIVASKELQITLTSRNKEKGIAVPMCGVPHHAAEGYIGKLIRKGFKVAICEQMEDARLAKKQIGTKLVRREVTRVVTPGTRGKIRPWDRKKTISWRALAQVGERVGLCGTRSLDRGISCDGIFGRRRIAPRAGRTRAASPERIALWLSGSVVRCQDQPKSIASASGVGRGCVY